MPAHNLRHTVSLAASTLLLAAGLVVSPAAPTTAPAVAASYSPPTGLTAVAVSRHTVALSWKAVPGAPAYRVQFAKGSSMTTYKTMDVQGTYFEWMYLNPDPKSGSARLKARTTYYFRVKAVSMSGANLSKYGTKVQVKTGGGSSPYDLPPVDLQATPQSSTSEYLSWSSRGPGVNYVVRYGTKADFSNASTTTFDAAGGELTGLSRSTSYYYQVKVVTRSGESRSNYSNAGTFTTTSSDGSPAITMSTYNVCSSKCGGWSNRLPVIAQTIHAQGTDVLALEEVGGTTDTELVNYVNKTYKANFALVDGYSNSVKLAYDADRFSVTRSGVLDLPTSGGGVSTPLQKYAVWAVLKDSQSGKSMFTVATHLVVGRSLWPIRKAQTQAIVDLVAEENTGGLPVAILGDFNSGKGYSPSNVIYDVLSASGYLEPLGNPDNSWAIDSSATAEHRIDLEYNTANQWKRLALRSKYANGYDIDYTWFSKSVRVALTQVVVNVDTKREFIGTMGSDHNMLSSTIHL